MKDTSASLVKKLKMEVDFIENYITGKKCSSSVFDKPGSFFVNLSSAQIDNITMKLRGKKGVYIFLVASNFRFSIDKIKDWNSCSGALINSQDSVNGNMVAFSAKKNQVFYIGSCYSESLLVRIRQHCKSNNNAQTASLKMGDKKRAWVKKHLVIYYFPVKKEYTKDELRIIITGIEKELHNRNTTIAGSSRT